MRPPLCSVRLATLATKTCQGRGSSGWHCPFIPSTLPKAAWVAGPVLGPEDTDKSGVVCPRGPPQGAEQAGDRMAT